MRVLVKSVNENVRCGACKHKVEFGQHYIIQPTHPKGRRDLKMDYKLREFHYPSCEHPQEGFGADGMGKAYEV